MFEFFQLMYLKLMFFDNINTMSFFNHSNCYFPPHIYIDRIVYIIYIILYIMEF